MINFENDSQMKLPRPTPNWLGLQNSSSALRQGSWWCQVWTASLM